MNERLNPSLLSTLRAIDPGSDDDLAFLFAATTNLYIEACRRLHGRVLLKPQDTQTIFAFISSILEAKVVDDYAPGQRSRQLTEAETAEVLGSVETAVRRA